MGACLAVITCYHASAANTCGCVHPTEATLPIPLYFAGAALPALQWRREAVIRPPPKELSPPGFGGGGPPTEFKNLRTAAASVINVGNRKISPVISRGKVRGGKLRAPSFGRAAQFSTVRPQSSESQYLCDFSCIRASTLAGHHLRTGSWSAKLLRTVTISEEPPKHAENFG